MTPTPIPGDTPEAKHTDTLVATLRAMSLGPRSYAAQAADRIEQLEAEKADLRSKLEKAREEALDDVAGVIMRRKHMYEVKAIAASERKSSLHERYETFLDIAQSHEYLLEAIRADAPEQANIRSPVQSEIKERFDPR